jgi:hypothetical protein
MIGREEILQSRVGLAGNLLPKRSIRAVRHAVATISEHQDDRCWWLWNAPTIPWRLWALIRDRHATLSEVLQRLFGDDEAGEARACTEYFLLYRRPRHDAVRRVCHTAGLLYVGWWPLRSRRRHRQSNATTPPRRLVARRSPSSVTCGTSWPASLRAERRGRNDLHQGRRTLRDQEHGADG